MRLVDENDVIKMVDKYTNDDGTLEEDISCIVENIPTAYDVEKVIKSLSNRAASAKDYWDTFNDSCAFGEMNAYGQAVEIVRSGGCEKEADHEFDK